MQNVPYKVEWRHDRTGQTGVFRCSAPCEYEARRAFGFSAPGRCPAVRITDIGIDELESERDVAGFFAFKSLQRHGGDKEAASAEMKQLLEKMDIDPEHVRERLARMGVTV